MVVLITGASHTGKTALAQKLLQKHRWPYLSIDHLKMGLIRSGSTRLTPLSSSDALTAYLWPIVREMVKTAIENSQDLIVEGCYIPFDWKKDFAPEYLRQIQDIFLLMSESYIKTHFADILAHADVAEQRMDDDCTPESLLADNARYLVGAQQHGLEYLLIDREWEYSVDFLLQG